MKRRPPDNPPYEGKFSFDVALLGLEPLCWEIFCSNPSATTLKIAGSRITLSKEKTSLALSS